MFLTSLFLSSLSNNLIVRGCIYSLFFLLVYIYKNNNSWIQKSLETGLIYFTLYLFYIYTHIIKNWINYTTFYFCVIALSFNFKLGIIIYISLIYISVILSLYLWLNLVVKFYMENKKIKLIISLIAFIICLIVLIYSIYSISMLFMKSFHNPFKAGDSNNSNNSGEPEGPGSSDQQFFGESSNKSKKSSHCDNDQTEDDCLEPNEQSFGNNNSKERWRQRFNDENPEYNKNYQKRFMSEKRNADPEFRERQRESNKKSRENAMKNPERRAKEATRSLEKSRDLKNHPERYQTVLEKKRIRDKRYREERKLKNEAVKKDYQRIKDSMNINKIIN